MKKSISVFRYTTIRLAHEGKADLSITLNMYQ